MQFKKHALSTVEIEHDHNSVLFNVRTYSQTKYSSNSGVFDEINAYLRTAVPEDRQTCINAVYQEVFAYLRSVREINDKSLDFLNKKAKEIYKYLDLKQLKNWLMNTYGVQVPPSAKQGLSDDLEAARTYQAPDYIDLVVFTVGSRMMLPIWGDLQGMITTTARNAGKAREYACLKTIVDTPLWQLPAVQRLLIYIRATIDSKGGSVSALIGGMGSDTLPDFLLAGAVVKRLVVAPLNVDIERGGLAKNVHGYIHSALKDFDVPGSKAKITSDSGGDSETGEDFSSLEKLRLKDDQPIGNIEKFKAWLQMAGPVGLAKSIDPTIPIELLSECIENNAQLEYIDLSECQLTLAKWMVYFIMPTLAIDLFTRMEISKGIMPALQALLVHWNFNELAVLITAERIRDLQALPAFTNTRITRQTLNLLLEAYPNQIIKSGANERQSNVGYQSIEAVANQFNGASWNLTVPATVISRNASMRPKVSGYPTPSDLSEQLALLTIKLWSLYSVDRFNESNASFT